MYNPDAPDASAAPSPTSPAGGDPYVAVVTAISRYRWVALAMATLAQLAGAMSAQMLAPLAPLFQPDMGLSKTEVGLFSSAAFIGAWVVLIASGSLTDRYGIRLMMSLGQIVSGAILITIAWATTLAQAFVIMFAVGMARGNCFPGSTKTVLEWFPPGMRATAMGIKQTGAPLGGIVAAATLPALGIVIGWRGAAVVAALAIIVAGVVTWLLYRSPVEPAGSATKSSMRVGLGEVLRNRTIWMYGSMAMMFVIAQMALIMYLALYLKEVVLVPSIPDEGARVVAAGGYLAIAQFGGGLGRVLWGLVSDRVFGGRRATVLALIGSISTVTMLVIAQFSVALPLAALTVLVFIAGLSAVGWNGVYHTLITETVGRKYAATGTGLSLTLIESGTIIGPPLFGLVADLSGGYQASWLVLCAFCGTATLLATFAARKELTSLFGAR